MSPVMFAEDARASEPVRWDAAAQPDCFWSSRYTAIPDARAAADEIEVRVGLPGFLGLAAQRRTIVLRMRAGFSLSDVLARLPQEIDSSRFCAAAALSRRFRAFADGTLVHSMTEPLVCRGPSTHIDILLVTAIEGG